VRRSPREACWFAYWHGIVPVFIVASVLTFPLTVYEGYFREHKYGLLNQTFGPWMRDQVIALAVSLILRGVLLAPLVDKPS
jgi:STE24 endopeptidase